MYYIHLNEYLSIKYFPVTPSLHPHCGAAVNGVGNLGYLLAVRNLCQVVSKFVLGFP